MFNDDTHRIMAKIDIIDIIHSKIRGDDLQPKGLDVHMLIQYVEWATWAEKCKIEGMLFKKSTQYMLKHLKPLFIKSFYQWKDV